MTGISSFGRRWIALPSASAAFALLQSFVTALIREKLTANRTYYVRTDGSDSNTGLVNSAGGAFLTIQKAIDVTAAIDQAGFTVTISVQAGTYSGGFTVSKSFTGPVSITGDTSTPSNVVISTTTAIPVANVGLATITVSGFKLTDSASSTACVYCAGTASVITLGAMEFGASSGRHIWVDNGAAVSTSANYTISGAASAHMYVNNNATFSTSGLTVTVSGTPAITSFCSVHAGGAVTVFSNTYSGAATGSRYDIDSNGVVNTFGSAVTLFPGNTAGTVATGGRYA